MSGALDLARSMGGSIDKDQVKSAVDQYLKYHDLHGGEQESRKSNYTDLVNKYYDLATGFYEYVWGDSIHFAGRYPGDTFREGIKRHQHFMALQLGLKKGMKVLDVGCGIGGPLIEIARFSSALITGLNYNDYQISRGKELIFSAGLSEQCCFLKGDFMNMPIADNTFDAAYAIEATCHAPDAVCLASYFCPIKYFALDEWCLTDRFDPNNAKHLAIKAEIELGDGLPDIRTTHQCVQAMKDAGFEVIFTRDLAEDFPCPWYQMLVPNDFSWKRFRLTRLGRIVTRAIISTLEFFHIAPAGSMGVYNFMLTASEGLLKGGQEGIFSPAFFVLGRKPLKETEIVKGNL
ncbi:cycloartenol-C-24-methyltransferase 1 isoform X1 [Sorghum bicolor]|uniref:cycloartenol-C-24-methyltransferase 1 isoform X1 n=1 Tax=Sorghum bicolor TaxID=4558 RepID=UPI000B426C02|nr:cycloartenol-C-24-methyltransferase 1 isoform X1 [Sorghum bicolor]XP_021320882.1 cycloartenol-C-24-methyltransferase 1 isoform X1 [Sorghum bicolor]XP_021320887.1 cycloartenol-C-24-methyltransferase 1 isoform X1 [Sorghum bicolor]XP_021320890.1 cycloartenol-C-24-methyltransferase 1 isoform X1 [Sorghum bicolor]|eukprot:XP_021320873.1 cycloartenol-C-24-methyltransferase 1 isoform X1 [Sorghum bicolor]